MRRRLPAEAKEEEQRQTRLVRAHALAGRAGSGPHSRRAQTQALPTRCGIPWLGFVVYPTHRRLKRRNAVDFRRRLERNLDAYQRGATSFGELDASVQGWINHVRYADTSGLREHLFASHPISPREP